MTQNMSSEIIQLTSQLLYDLSMNRSDRVWPQFSDHAIWIGPMDIQWAEDRKTAEQLCLAASNESPPSCLITDEEYHLLIHSKDLWIVYGRFMYNQTASDGRQYRDRMRITVVWQKKKGSFHAIHIHSSFSKDGPSEKTVTFHTSEDFNDYIIKQLTPAKQLPMEQKKLVFKDCSGCYHYLYQSEILAIEADKQYSNIILPKRTVRVRKQISEFESLLSAEFSRVHRSYLVNLSHITEIWLYHIRISNGRELPVSREKYSPLKRMITNKE